MVTTSQHGKKAVIIALRAHGKEDFNTGHRQEPEFGMADHENWKKHDYMVIT